MQFQKKSIPTLAWKVIENSLGGGGGGGGLKVKILEAVYEAKLEFPWRKGGGVQNKKPSVGGVWIFSGTAQ